jgi:DNA-binding NarL/FixJ family response regulator
MASGMRHSLRRWRQAIQGPCTVHEVTDRRSLELCGADRRPAALLLDLHLPGLGGVDGVAAIQRLWPTTKILLLTSRPNEKEGIAALKAGARGYCDRGIGPGLLGKALEVVQKGEIWIGRKFIPHLLGELTTLTEQQQKDSSPELDRRLDHITAREREVVRLLSAGASNKEMAQKLNVAERTVKAHLTALFNKLGISGRLQLALFVLEHSRSASPPDRVGANARLFSKPSRENP